MTEVHSNKAGNVIEAVPMEIAVMLRLKLRNQTAVWEWSNITGLKAVTSPKEPNPHLAQEYLDEVGEKQLYRNLRDFGEYQNWAWEWKPASNIFKQEG